MSETRKAFLAAHGWAHRRFSLDGRTVERWYGPGRAHTGPGLPLAAAWAAHTAAVRHGTDGYATKETNGL